MVTGSPSKRISPSSIGWMPAMHLINVDLPAPLSPTSAITSPSCTSRSTSVSACTDPNDLVTPRGSRRGASLTGGCLIPHQRRRRPVGASVVCHICVELAVLRVLAVADLAPLEPAAGDQLPPVRLGDHLRRDQVSRLLRAALGGDEAGGRRLLALDDPDRGLRGLGRQDADVVPDRSRLPARD